MLCYNGVTYFENLCVGDEGLPPFIVIMSLQFERFSVVGGIRCAIRKDTILDSMSHLYCYTKKWEDSNMVKDKYRKKANDQYILKQNSLHLYYNGCTW